VSQGYSEILNLFFWNIQATIKSDLSTFASKGMTIPLNPESWQAIFDEGQVEILKSVMHFFLI